MKRWLTWVCAAGLFACSGSDDGGNDRPTGGLNSGSGATVLTGGVANSGGSAFTGGTAGSGGVQNGSGGNGATGGSVNVCSSAEIEPVVNRSPGNLLVIFDRSLSMRDDFANGLNRFDSVDMALRNGLAGFACPPSAPDGEPCIEALTVGSILFPSLDGLGCAQVDAIDAATQINWLPVGQFLTAWQNYWAPGSPNARLMIGTPIEPAFQRGAEAIAASTLPGSMAVLFLTDGESTCRPGDPGGDFTAAAMQAQAWNSMGIKTYVVSVADQGSAFNDQVAQAGGSGMSINPADTQQLNDAISGIVQQTVELVDCRSSLSGKQITNIPGACMRGKVRVGTSDVACDPDNGFQVVSATEIELFGAACDSLKAGLKLTATFPCDVLLE